MKKVLACILLLIVILCFVDCLMLVYDSFTAYQYLQSIQASGSEYLGFFGIPFLFLADSIVAVVAYGLYKKLTINRFMTAGVEVGFLVIGALIMISVMVFALV